MNSHSRPLPQHLQAALDRLDLLLHREILRMRAAYQLSLDEFRGLYISDEQVDQLLQQAAARDGLTPDIDVLTRRAARLKEQAGGQPDPGAPWQQMVDEYRLSPIEEDLLLLALAPELDLKYETLIAYLNNDVTRKWPTHDAALRLLGDTPAGENSLRAALLPGSTLLQEGLLQPVSGSPGSPAWLGSGFRPDPGLVHLVLGQPLEKILDRRLAVLQRGGPAWEDLPVASGLASRMRRLPALFARGNRRLLVLEGRAGAGRFQAAAAACAELGRPLLKVNLAALLSGSMPAGAAAQLVLYTRLERTGVYLENGEALLNTGGSPLPENHLVDRLWDLPGPAFLAVPPGTNWQAGLDGRRTLRFDFPDPDPLLRGRLWASAAASQGLKLSPAEVETLANRFILTPGQIEEAVREAADWQALEPDNQPASGMVALPPGMDALLQAARRQSGQSLGRLAIKVPPVNTWSDLVLPPATLRRVGQVAAAIRNTVVVYTDWGFAERIVHGRGLNVLFSGTSGTGKTMTASIIARDLGLDLYKIDLSGIVSKYIGETEKNLDRIFRAAYASNAILFFDEADALFGKRSEVKDAHDRYANIEVAYLLQKMEEHEGVVILASNLSKNIDPAFARRMHYVVEFSLPDEAHRERLWRGMFPAQAPLADDVDFAFLAGQFDISGGDIKNVALEAAFLAAQDGWVIGMPHLVRALANQKYKEGKVPTTAEFKQYYALITGEHG